LRQRPEERRGIKSLEVPRGADATPLAEALSLEYLSGVGYDNDHQPNDVRPRWPVQHNRIAMNPKIMFGKPVITGTRIPVELILRKLGAGLSPEAITAQHPDLTMEDIRAAVAFAADHVPGVTRGELP
jgi:uncharacterized protein (DUF433 family)